MNLGHPALVSRSGSMVRARSVSLIFFFSGIPLPRDAANLPLSLMSLRSVNGWNEERQGTRVTRDRREPREVAIWRRHEFQLGYEDPRKLVASSPHKYNNFINLLHSVVEPSE